MTSDLCSSVDSAIDGVARGGGSRWESFKEVAEKVLHDGITWERIAVLFYVAGRLAVRVGPEPEPLIHVLLALHTSVRVNAEGDPAGRDIVCS